MTPTLGAQIVSWGGVPPDEISAETLAASALGALKAQQASEAAWLALAPTLMNPIRERRSAALQAYLTGATRRLRQPHLPGRQRALRLLPHRRPDELVHADVAHRPGVHRRANLRGALLHEPGSALRRVVVNLDTDDTWSQWEWMRRYRIWEANREVFLYPENWLIESQRPNRTEIYQTFEQEVRQGQSTTDYLETVVLNYIDRLDGLAHLHVTGTCEDPAQATIYVVARTLADPPVFYLRTYANGAWTGWTKIPLDIKAHQAVPAMYRGRICLFWMDMKVTNEPQQNFHVQPSSDPRRARKWNVT